MNIKVLKEPGKCIIFFFFFYFNSWEEREIKKDDDWEHKLLCVVLTEF